MINSHKVFNGLLLVIVCAAAFITMCFWWMDGFVSDPVSTKMNTAFCILLLSLQLSLLKHVKYKFLVVFLLIITLGVSLISLIENIFPIQLGIDQWLFITEQPTEFHLMSLATAGSIILLCICIAFLLKQKPLFSLIAILLSYIVGFNSLVVVVGRIYMLSGKSYPSYINTESFLTASLFLLLVIVISRQNHYTILLSAFLGDVSSKIQILRVSFIYFISLALVGLTILTNVRSGDMRWEFGFTIFTAASIFILFGLSFYFGKQLDRRNKMLLKSNLELTTTNELIHQTLQNNNYLVKEIHHRIKNNLQMMISYLTIKLFMTPDNDVQLKDFIDETKSRVHLMAILHEQLLHSEGLNRLNIKHYIKLLINNIIQSQSRFGHLLNENIEEFEFDMDMAINLGFITNEIVSNIIKHAYPTSAGVIDVSLVEDNGFYIYSIRDYGMNGGPKVLTKQTDTYGQELINIFTRQLKGKLSIDSTQQGVHYQITFPEGSLQTKEATKA